MLFIVNLFSSFNEKFSQVIVPNRVFLNLKEAHDHPPVTEYNCWIGMTSAWFEVCGLCYMVDWERAQGVSDLTKTKSLNNSDRVLLIDLYVLLTDGSVQNSSLKLPVLKIFTEFSE